MLVTGPEKLNPRALINHDFELVSAVEAGWLAEISWAGRSNVVPQHLSYALAVYGLKLEKLLPTLYRVDSPTVLTPVSPAVHVPALTRLGTLPGGWFGILGSVGRVTDWVHEAEELTRHLPLGHLASVASEVVTGVSSRRIEDILLESAAWTLTDPAAVAAPVVASFTAVAQAQMGDIITYTAAGVTGTSALVWEFWDGEVRVTAPTVLTQQKLVTAGGVLSSQLTAVNAVGGVTTLTCEVLANYAPEFLSVTVSKNDGVAPYDTNVIVVARDFDSDSVEFPSAHIYGTIDGTLDSTTDLEGGKVQGTLTIPLTITDDSDYTLTVSDDPGATRTLPLAFRAKQTRPLIVSVTAIPRFLRVGAGSTLKLIAVAIDLDGEAIASFSWDLLVENGWAADHTYAGTTQALNGGAWQNTLVVDVASEAEGQAVALVTVTTVIGKVSQGSVLVEFDTNQAPVLRNFTIVPGTVMPGQECQVGADAYDPDGDAISYSWSFDAPVITRVGNPVLVTPVYGTIPGTLVMTDVLGATTLQVIPQVLITSSVVVAGTVGQQFSYVPTMMGDPTPVISATQLPVGMILVNGTITGVPAVIGRGTIELVATQGILVDTRHVYVTVVAGIELAAPTNLLVNGLVDSYFHSGENISVAWANDSVNYTILRFYRLDSSLAFTVTLDPGVNSYFISNFNLVQVLGAEQSFIVRALSFDGVSESGTFVESICTVLSV
jgi:hypothetical protein